MTKDCFRTIEYKGHFINTHFVRVNGTTKEDVLVLFRHIPEIDHYTQYQCKTFLGAKRLITRLVNSPDYCGYVPTKRGNNNVRT